MSNIVQKIYSFNKFNELVFQSLKLVEKNSKTQIPIQISKNKALDDSTGWLKASSTEFEYCSIHPELVNSIFEEYINSLPCEVFRTRIMILGPKSSYIPHKDLTPRLHIPLITNKETAFLFPDDNYMHQLNADGSVYWVDTTKYHTFVNWSNENRIHIVSVIKK